MRLLLFVALGAAVLAGCDTSTVDPDPTPAPWDNGTGAVPLAVGNEWVFSATSTRFDWTTGAPIESRSLATSDTLRVVGSEVRDGETWFQLDVFQGPTTGASSVLDNAYSGWYTNRPDGLYRDYGSEPFREIRYPAETGDRYTVLPANYSLTDSLALFTERAITVKRTDFPVVVHGRTYEGVLRSATTERARVFGRDYGFLPASAPLREVFSPEVGFAYLEAGYFGQSGTPGLMVLQYLSRFTLTDATILN